MSGFVRGRLVAASLLGLGLVLTALPASAHDELVGATPADGAVVHTVPNAFVLEVFEPVRDEPALVLRDDADEVVAELDADVDKVQTKMDVVVDTMGAMLKTKDKGTMCMICTLFLIVIVMAGLVAWT